MSRPHEITEALLADWPLPGIADGSDKEARGRILVLAAGPQVAGATLLTATAALRAGAGKLQVGAPRRLAQALALAMPEARVRPLSETQDGEVAPGAAVDIAEAVARSDCVVLGPGMLDEAAAGELALRLAQQGGPPLVIDAAAMVGLAAEPARCQPSAGRMVLTPHPGEMAALTGLEKREVVADPAAAGRLVATRFQAVVAVKGTDTLIVTPDGTTWRYAGGPVGLGTSGSGDVLAGLIAGLIARGATPAQGAVWGVFVHGQAGVRLSARVGRLGFLARELLEEIAPILNDLETRSVP